jgi:hypothetical protein
MSQANYETKWRERLQDYRPEASDADWLEMRNVLSQPPLPGSTPGGGSWGYWLLVPVLIAVAGYVLFTDDPVPEPREEVTVTAPPPPEPVLVDPLPRIAPPPIRPASPPPVSVAVEVATEVSVEIAPAPRRPAARMIPQLPLVNPPFPVVSQTADWRVKQLKVDPPSERKGSAADYYPPTRIRN